MKCCSPADFDRLRAENGSSRQRLSEDEPLPPLQSEDERRELLDSCDSDFMNFVYVVTHDLRSPLVNIRGLASELRLSIQALEPLKTAVDRAAPTEQTEKAIAALDQDLPEMLKHIDASVSKMGDLISRLFDFSNSAHRPLEVSTVDLGELIESVIASMAAEIRTSQCALEVGPMPTLQADPLALEQVFSELIRNSLKFLDPKRPGRIAIRSAAEPGKRWIQISDTGRGIAERDLAKVFLPFRRSGNMDTQGDGMGLALVKALVRRHRGCVTCVSTLGEGTTITLGFPAGPESIE